MKWWMFLGIAMCLNAVGDNPFVTHIYTADPTARVFDGVLYVYPSHDIKESPGLEGANGFMMEDYHVFSSTDLMNFEDHGVILSQDDVDWVEEGSYAMWAPDCIEKDGKYYFYFPGNFHVGVAISDTPVGPFIPHQEPVDQANGIDPGLFIDDDGTPYLYFGGGDNDSLQVMRMRDDMITPDMEKQWLTGLGTAYKEGPFLFKRDGVYYFTYPYSPDGSEEIHYATGTSPLGPFIPQGTIIDRWTDGCWTDHHSVVKYGEQWYLFYHHHDISKDGTLRSICADRLHFNPDGSIQKVIPTRRGVGIRRAEELIQVDRYLDGSGGLTTPVSESDEYIGFYLADIADGSWINYPDVDFETNGFVSVSARIASSQSGTVEVYAGGTNGTLLASIPVTNTGSGWEILTATLSTAGMAVTGLQDLVLVFRGSGTDLFNVDWVCFNRPGSARLFFEGRGVGEVLVNGNRSLKVYQNGSILNAPEAVTLSAHPESGYAFEGWTLNGTVVSNITSLHERDVVTARFKPDEPTGYALAQLEAEMYSEQYNTVMVGGDTSGSAVGYIQNGSYIVFRNLDFSDGAAGFSAHVSSGTAGGTLSLCLDSLDALPVCSIAVTNTGGWNTWTTKKADITPVSGVHDVYIRFEGESDYLMNLDWIKFYKLLNWLDVLEAEDHTEQFGIQTETCTEGGENIGYIDDGDYILFEGVAFSGDATQLLARASSQTGGGSLSVCLDDINAPPACTISVPATGGWQNWNSYACSVSIPAGHHDVYIKFSGGSGFLLNLNWIKFEGDSGYAKWVRAHGLSSNTGFLDDVDRDGIENLLEYGLDMSPVLSNRLTDIMTITASNMATSHLGKTDVAVALYCSSNLVDWSNMSPSATPVDLPADAVYYEYDIAVRPNGFFRWVVDAL